MHFLDLDLILDYYLKQMTNNKCLSKVLNLFYLDINSNLTRNRRKQK